MSPTSPSSLFPEKNLTCHFIEYLQLVVQQVVMSNNGPSVLMQCDDADVCSQECAFPYNLSM